MALLLSEVVPVAEALAPDVSEPVGDADTVELVLTVVLAVLVAVPDPVGVGVPVDVTEGVAGAVAEPSEVGDGCAEADGEAEAAPPLRVGSSVPWGVPDAPPLPLPPTEALADAEALGDTEAPPLPPALPLNAGEDEGVREAPLLPLAPPPVDALGEGE